MDSNTDQWTTIESPEIDPQKCGQLIFDKSTKAIEKGESSQQMVLKELDTQME